MTPIDAPLVLFILTIMGAAFGFWKYIDGKLTSVRTEAGTGISAASALASLARQELAEHRLHTAEVYVSKQGLREQTAQIMEAIHGVKTAVDGMALRVDRVVENQGKPASRVRP